MSLTPKFVSSALASALLKQIVGKPLKHDTVEKPFFANLSPIQILTHEITDNADYKNVYLFESNVKRGVLFVYFVGDIHYGNIQLPLSQVIIRSDVLTLIS